MSLLGIDIGSSSCKGVVFSVDGKVLASSNKSYSTINAGPSMVEIDPRTFREAVFMVIRDICGHVKSDPVEALAISSHGETTIPVDKDGIPVGPAIMNSDNRALDETRWWDKTFGKEEIYEITGVPLHSMFSLNKILWIRKNIPEWYSGTKRFLSVGDYILTQLELPPFTDFSLASRTMAFDINTRRWSEKILDHCEISPEKLGIPVASGTVAGIISKKIAKDLGLNEGTIVAVGGHDQPCGALGAGAINDGDVYDSAGTYECITAVSGKPMNNKKAFKYSLNSYCHVVPEKFVTLGFFPAGIVSGWFVEKFCGEDRLNAHETNKDLYDVLSENTLMFCHGPTGLTVTPHFVGSCTPYWDVRAKGVMAGFTPEMTKYHLYKAIYEGISCELAVNICALEEIVGGISEMTINGGNSRSLFTVQLRADITGKTIHILKNEEAVCLGAAILAGISIGVFKSAEDAVNKVVQIEKNIMPDISTKAVYDKQIKRYSTIYQSLEGFRAI